MERSDAEALAMIEQFAGKPGEKVAPVDPADLKALYAFGKKHARPNTVIGYDAITTLVKPGTDMAPLMYRWTMLGNAMRYLQPAFPGAEMSELVIDAIATIDMEGMGIGQPRTGLPFSMEDLLAHVRHFSEKAS